MPTLPHRAPLLLELDLTEPPVEPDPHDPLARLRARRRPPLRAVLRALHEAGDDRRVGGLVAKVGGPLAWPVAQELRLGVLAFAASGKPTVAYAEDLGAVGGLASYVLATAFGEVWLQPSGELGPLGVGLETTFLRGTLDRLGVRGEFEQRHEYKNAPDLLTRTEPTPAHREALERLADSVFDDALRTVAEARRRPPEEVRTAVASGPLAADEAAAAGLVDRVGFRDEAYAAVRARLSDRPEDVRLLFADRWHPRPTVRTLRPPRDHVALVEVRGAIGPGASRRGPGGPVAGSGTVTADLRAAREDEHAKAVLLRVDSPGGSVVASEAIWREVCRVGESGRPVVVSMGTLAASGGYYVACPADVVVALPATLTGSIGVFGGKLVVGDLLDRIGVTTTAVERGGPALMYSPRRGFEEGERARLAALVDRVYADFVAKVAAGRRRTEAEVDAVARGRVWTGADAVDAGLVDRLGGLRDAAAIARERAGLPDAAPLRPARHVPALARLGRPRNSEDPRVAGGLRWPTAAQVAADLLPADELLRMPPVALR